MRYISLIFIVLVVFIASCGVDNTTTTKWDGCIKDSNCESGEKCVSGNCVETETCEDDTACLNGQFCNEAKLCENHCESNDDCGVGFVCNTENKKCEKDENTHLCEKDGDCSKGEICKDYKCIDDENTDACETDLNCLNGQHCSDKVCVADCTNDSCDEGYKCNPDTKECETATCQSNNDCDKGFYCEDNICKTKEYECTDNNECFQGYECKDNKCVSTNTDECNTASDCPGSPEIDCMGAHWECRNNKCVGACGEEKYCGDYICSVEIGENNENCPQDCKVEPECDLASDCDGQLTIECMGAHWECKENKCVEACGEERYCGDYICSEEIGENSENCPQDCNLEPPFCGDGSCDMGEWDSCPEDCQPSECRENVDCANNQWNVRCFGHWSCENNQCEEQCDMDSCGDERCDRELGETSTSCPMDCNNEPECRGDRDCNDREYCTDDGFCKLIEPSCGNGQCEEYLDENPETCPQDCAEEPPFCLGDIIPCPDDLVCVDNQCIGQNAYCGDNNCDIDLGENANNCPQDCNVEPPLCEADILEPNSGDSPKNVSITSYNNLTITYEKKDSYSFNYDGVSNIRINFDFINENGDIDVYALQNNRVVTSSEGYSNNETLVIDPNGFRAGIVIIDVALIRNEGEPIHECQIYNMTLKNDVNSCIPDDYEPNNTRRESKLIETGSYDLSICEQDTDWFNITIPASATLMLTSSNRVKSELYQPRSREPIAISEPNSTGNETLYYTNNNPDSENNSFTIKLYKEEIIIDNDSFYNYNFDIEFLYID